MQADYDWTDFFLREINTDKVCSTGGCIYRKYKTDSCPVDDTAKDTDKQNVISYDIAWNNVCENTCKENHQTGIKGEFFSNITETNIDRDTVDKDV